MALPMDFSATQEAFRQPLPVRVFDCEGEYVSGVWKWGERVPRPAPINAIILSLSLEQLALYQDGDVGEGGIAVLTSTPLYYTNILGDGQTLNRQSFVEYQGRLYRVVGDGFISGPGQMLIGNASFKCYHCLRWLGEIEVSPTPPVPTDDLPPWVGPTLECTPDSVLTLLHDVMCAALGYAEDQVIIETRSDRRPSDKRSYATIWLRRCEPLTENSGDFFVDQASPDSEDGTQVLDNETLFSVQFQFIGVGAYTQAMAFASALQNGQRFFDLWRVVGFAGIDSVQDISTSYGAHITQRAMFTCDFYACFGKRYPLDWYKVSQWDFVLPDKTMPAEGGGTTIYDEKYKIGEKKHGPCISSRMS